MAAIALDVPTRERTILYRLDTSAEGRRVLVLDGTDMWNFYVTGLEGVVQREDIALTQYLGEAMRAAQERGLFDAYVINLDRRLGAESTLRDGIDLAERIVDILRVERESMWLLSQIPSRLQEAQRRGFIRLYEGLNEASGKSVYPTLPKFMQDLRQDLIYGRSGI